jgi:hypothetical protein
MRTRDGRISIKKYARSADCRNPIGLHRRHNCRAKPLFSSSSKPIALSRDVAGPLLKEIGQRTLRHARRKVKWLDPMQAEHVVEKVEYSILLLLLSEEPSRQADFLEIAFAKSVEQRTLDEIRKLKSSTLLGHRGEFRPAYGDTDVSEFESKRPLLLAPDSRPDPLEIFLKAEDKERVKALVEKASGAMKDPRHLEAVVLHFVHGWPIESKKGIPDLVSHFGVSARQIRKWIATALKEMRAKRLACLSRMPWRR